MRSIRIIILLFIIVAMLQSCSVEKRIYRNGYYRNFSGSGATVHSDDKTNSSYFKMNQPLKSSVQYSKTDSSGTSRQPDSTKNNIRLKNYFSSSSDHLKPVQFAKTKCTALFKLAGKTRAKIDRKFSHKKTGDGNLKDDLGLLAAILIEIGLIFLVGLAIQAIFPALTLLIACLIAIPVFALLVFLLYLLIAAIWHIE
jgi:hypothetical protein